MKNFLKRILCLSTCLMGFITSVEAVTLRVGGDSTPPGATRSVNIELVDDASNMADFNKVEFQLNISGTAYASIEKFEPKAAMTFQQDPGVLTTYSFEGNTLVEGTIGTITYKTTADLVGDFKITPINVKFYKADGTYLQPGDAGVKLNEGSIKYVKPKSGEAFLTNLSVSQGEMTPEFSNDIKEYTVVVKDTIQSVKINAESSPGSTKTGVGTKRLEMGANEFEITVTAEDGATKNTYKVTIIRGKIEEPSAYLKSLDINNIGIELSPKFDKNNDKYTVKVGKNITQLDFKYEREDSLAEVTIDGNEDFKEGENLVKISVKSSDGESEQVYEITVIKEKEEEEKTVEAPKDDKKKEKKTNIWLIILIIGLILAILTGLTVILFQKKKKKKKNKEKNDENKKMPLKRRNLDEPTYEIDKVEKADSSMEAIDEDESVTDILKGELFDEEKTQRFDSSTFKEVIDTEESNESKTKEFNFKDFE